ncbi:MAG: glycosyltransferase family 4 protein [Firmicutes bacterium]|nr:glycosyltransferase family 4 protein [Bacillota bacterium]
MASNSFDHQLADSESMSGLSVLLNVSSVPDQVVGAGKYIYQLACGLAQNLSHSLYLCSRKSDTGRWLNITLDGRRNKLLPFAPSSKSSRILYEEFAIAKLALDLMAANPHLRDHFVLHGPHYVIPRNRQIVKAVTVHDLTFIEHPKWHERGKVLYFTQAIYFSLKAAQVVICPSEYTAQKLIDIYRPKAPVVVARHGVDSDIFRISSPELIREDTTIMSDFQISDRYILHVGTLEPRKNIPLLIEAFDAIAGDDGDLQLVLAGKDGWQVSSIDKAIGESKYKNRIKRLGYVTNRQVAALLRNASVVCYPSFEEGFGLPALEALACGAPLVTTKDSAMSEVAGKAALLVDPGSVGDLAEALREQLSGGSDVIWRQKLGLETAGNFTWEKSLKSHLHAYRLALGG